MRTTLSLDDDVAALLRRARAQTKKPFKQLVNEALRVGLAAAGQPKRRAAPYRIQPVDLGRCFVASIDNVAEVLAAVEGEAYR